FGERRADWAALALALPGREVSRLARLAPIAGGMLMPFSLKVGAGIVALVAAGWWMLRSEERGPAPLRSDVPAQTARAPLELDPARGLVPATRVELERAPGADRNASEATARELLLRLADAHDRAPLPHYGIEVRGASEHENAGETVLSDERGELRIDLA